MKTPVALYVKEVLVLEEILLANTYWGRLKGYMFQKRPMQKGILFRNCNDLHSFFMHFDIDLYFLNENDVVVHIERGFSKNRILKIKNAVHVLEVPSTQLEGFDLSVGDAFYFKSGTTSS